MALDLEKIMILTQRRLTHLREIYRLTQDLGEALTRNDEVSVSLVLEMRAAEMAKVDQCQEDIWNLGEAGPLEAAKVKKLMTCDPFQEETGLEYEERKIYDIRRSSKKIIKEIQDLDRILNKKVAGEKSFYNK